MVSKSLLLGALLIACDLQPPKPEPCPPTGAAMFMQHITRCPCPSGTELVMVSDQYGATDVFACKRINQERGQL